MYSPPPDIASEMSQLITKNLDIAVSILLRTSPETAKMYTGPRGSNLILALQELRKAKSTSN